MNLSCKANETKNSCYIANIEARLIYFIFYYIKDGDDKAFERAGTTRYNLIKEKTKKENNTLILSFPIKTSAEFKSAWDKIKNMQKEKLSLIKEGHIFSHASKGESEDGLEFLASNSEDGTISYDEILSLPRLSWAKDATLTLYGCNSGISGEARDLSIAELFSESQKTIVCGQKGYAYFSESDIEYKKISTTSKVVYLWAYKRGQNSVFGNGFKIKPQIVRP